MSAFSRYRLIRPLRRGGMAEVHEGLAVGEHGFERRVAIKRLPHGRDPSEADLSAFIDEARLASRLHHPSIVAVLDFGLHEDLPFMVLEWVDGADLRVLVQRAEAVSRKMPESVALHAVTEVAHALDHAHRARGPSGRLLGLVHRDVSPDNILISFAGDVKLTDFGIARASDRLSQTVVGLAKGKLAWMAPEQAKATTVDARTDIFSLGCVLLWLLTGKSPLADSETRHHVLQGMDFSIPDDLPPDLHRIIRRATRVRASERFESAEVMARETGTALSSRLDRDARGALMTWLGQVGHAHTVEIRHPLAEMMGLDLVLNGPDAPLRRFGSEVSSQVPQDTVRENPSDPTRVIRSASVATVAVTAAPEPDLEPPALVEADPQVAQAESLSDAPGPQHLGEILHGFRLVEPLGLGASAWVYRAEHTVLQREVAIKILTAAAARHAGVVRRLMREAQALGRLQHPNIVSVQDFGYTDRGAPFMAMELVRGSTLKDILLREGHFAPGRVVTILRQIAAALIEAHAQNVIHRDLKLSNVMLVRQSGPDLVKVLDFGIARLIGNPGTQITGADSLLGTPQYMAPEQFTDPAEVGPPADVYGLGVVAYALISARMPFPGQRMEVLQYKLQDRPRPLTTDTGLESLIFRMLAFDALARPTAAEVASTLENITVRPAPDPSFDWSSSTPTPTPPPMDGPTAIRPANARGALGGAQQAPRVDASETTQRGPISGLNPRSRTRFVLGLALTTVFACSTLVAYALLSIEADPIPAPLAQPEASNASPPGTPSSPSLIDPNASPPVVERAPVAIPRILDDPRPPPAAPPTPAAPAPRRPATRTPRRPDVRVSRAAVERQVGERLRKQGLTARDVAAHHAYRRARREITRAASRGDSQKVQQALESLQATLVAFEVDERLLEDKLARVERKLKEAAPRLEAPTLEALEGRYLDARANLRAASSPAAKRQMARTLNELERSVGRAKTNPSSR